jgi:benzoate membrane transport protein
MDTVSLAAKRHFAIRDLDGHAVVNGLLACLFATTAPLAILLASARQGGLDGPLISSWIFAAYAIGGALTVPLALRYRQPLGMGWSIPAAALVGPAFAQFTVSDIVGAYVVTALLVLALGVTRTVSRLMAIIPLPVMMGMTAGVFLPFGVNILRGLAEVPATTSAMAVAFFVTPRLPALGSKLPPILMALAAGLAAMTFEAPISPLQPVEHVLVRPLLLLPTFSWPALLALVLPLAVTVVGIHNPQGFAVLRQTGHSPPVDVVTDACGVASILMAIFGCGPACLTGPANAIIVSSGERMRHYAAALVFGLAMIMFGLFAPVAVDLAAALPTQFIAVLGGLALLPVLRSTFVAAFSSGRFTFGALVSFVTATSGIALLHIGGAFWALVFGTAASFAFEHRDFARSNQ